MKEKLVIRHFGPVKDLDAIIRTFTVFIGTQGSGKSTVSKVLTICRDLNWYIKILDGSHDILEPFKKFGIEEFFHDDTYIHYSRQEDDVEVFFQEGRFRLHTGNLSSEEARNFFSGKIIEANKDFLAQMGIMDVSKPDIEEKYGHLLQANARTMLYIPAERNMVGMLSGSLASVMAAKIPLYDALLEYMSVFEKAKAALKEYYVPFLNVSFAIKDGAERIWLGQGNEKREPLSLQSCSSGLQSVLPLLMSIDYSLQTYYFNTFVIEEPEQNLFPSNQRELLSYLVNIYNQSETYGMVFTTHSPYTLSCMNVMMLAGKLIRQYPEIRDEVLGVVGSCHYVSPEEVAVYKLDPLANVYCENLKNSKTGLIGINALDEVSEYIGEDFDRLSDIYRKQLRKK